MEGWNIPDWLSVISFIWAVLASIFGGWTRFKKDQSEFLTHRFLVGLKASATQEQRRQIDDELQRIKPSKPRRA